MSIEKYPLLALDLDGTLVHMGGDINPLDLVALAKYQEYGGIIIIASGRPPRSLAKYVELLGTSGWMVASGGALVLNQKENKQLLEVTMPADLAIRVIRLLRTIPDVEMSMEAGSEFYADNEYEWVTKIRNDGYKIAGIGDLELFVNGKVHKVLGSSSILTYQQFEDLLYQNFRESIAVTSSYKDLMEITAPNVNKYLGMDIVLRNLGYDWNHVAAIGDQRNDIELIAHSGFGAAVGNALVEVKAVADVVVADCDNGGVAEFIEMILGN